jgi:DNA modification methylase
MESGNTEWRIEQVALSEVVRWPRNPKLHAESDLDASMERFGFVAPGLRDEGTGRLVFGHGRVDSLVRRKAAGLPPPERITVRESDGEWLFPIIRGVRFKSAAEAEAYLLADNRIAELGGWSKDLGSFLARAQADTEAGLKGVGWSATDAADIIRRANEDTGGGPSQGDKPDPTIRQTLAARFGVPPFTVLDARQGYWLRRKKLWRSLGFQGALGRGNAITFAGGNRDDEIGRQIRKTGPAVSAFDPVLCEIVTRWFAPPGGAVFDPFAGGCTSGIVTSVLGRAFVGLELRKEQIDVNNAQAQRIGVSPRWINGDSARMDDALGPPEELFDLMFTDPPYFTLEQYSDQAGDGSGLKSYADFISWLERVLLQALARLKKNRFAVLKIGEVRGRDGSYVGFVADCIAIMKRAGLAYVNEAVFVTSVGSVRLRASRAFVARRILGKVHQNVLVFCKGDPRTAAQAVGVVDVADPESLRLADAALGDADLEQERDKELLYDGPLDAPASSTVAGEG